jgi:hypothetical protein
MALVLGLSSFSLTYSCKKSENSTSKAEGPVVVQTFKVVKKPLEDKT